MRPLAPSSSAITALVAGLVFAGHPATAQESNSAAPGVELAGGQTAGSFGVNLAAGNANQQANVGVLVPGETALSAGLLAQSLSTPAIEPSPAAEASIANGALAGSTGRLAINLTTGSANQQANLAVISLGFVGQLATAATLTQSRAPTVKSEAEGDNPDPTEYSVHIGEAAFEASSGLVQVNLTAGDANTSANIFSLSVLRQ